MYEDKFRGMLLLGGFGDALGAPTELHNTAAGNYTQHAWRRRCSLSVASRWYNQTLYPNTWEIWPPPNYIKGLKGVVTDDTSQRIAILQSWLETVNASGKKLNEADFQSWMLSMDNALYNMTLKEPEDWYNLRRREMIADFLCMFSVEEGNSTGCKRGNNSFYIENATACFGLYSYISLGAAVDPQTYNFSTTYSYFRDFASLDQFYGHEVTGLAVALVSSAFSVVAPSESCSQWMHHQLSSWLPRLIGRAKTTTERLYLLFIWRSLLQSWNFGEHLARENASEVSFLKKYVSDIYLNPNITQQQPMKPHDPLTMLSLIMACLSFARDNLPYAFELLTSSAGDTDTNGAFLGIICGAYYGYSNLSELTCDNSTLGIEMSFVETFLNGFYDFNVTSAASLFFHLRRGHVID